ncbi:hypothetical protein [Parasphingorhabdus litoris]|uniref:hypothetical protein n=1 Tax=Parasphingorhabdus litoris TaxID=394733 RepID=UPI001E42C7F0|nr:hypothetical protein [Parasphingorhabdus litoris]
MSQFSPLTRKILALGLLILGLLLVWRLIVSPLAAQMESSLTELDDARFQRLRLENLQARPQPEEAEALPADIVFSAESREEAVSGLSSHISGLAAQNDLQVANITSRPGAETDKLLAFDFALIGEEVSVTRFINQAERGSPMIRFRSWQIEAGNDSDPNLQFSGQVVAAWMKP